MRNSRLDLKTREEVQVVEYNDDTDSYDVVVPSIKMSIKLVQIPNPGAIRETGEYIEAGKFIAHTETPNPLIKGGLIVVRGEDQDIRRLNIESSQTIDNVQQLIMERVV